MFNSNTSTSISLREIQSGTISKPHKTLKNKHFKYSKKKQLQVQCTVLTALKMFNSSNNNTSPNHQPMPNLLYLSNYVNQSQNIGDAILNYLNENRSALDAPTLLNNIQEMVKYQQTQDRIKQQSSHHKSTSSHASSSSSNHHNPLIELKKSDDSSKIANSTPSSSNSSVNNNTNKQSQSASNMFSQQDVSLYIKPARKTAKYFLTYIPPKLYCSPYKYDLMLRIPVTMNETHDFIFNLLDSESREKITKNNKGDEAYCIERTKTQRKNYLKPGFVNATFRLNFSICSFHNSRKPFLISVHIRAKSLNQNNHNTGGDIESDQLILISDPFSIFARKTGAKGQSIEDDWGLPNQFSDSSNNSTEEEEEDEEEDKKKKKKKEKATKRKRKEEESKPKKKKSIAEQKQPEPEKSISPPEVFNHSVNKETPIQVDNQDITTKIVSNYDQIVDNNQEVLSSGNIFDGDQWSQLFGSTTLSPDIAPFLEEEIVTCQQQPQPQPAIFQQFGTSSTPQQSQPSADLTMLLYQELLKQFNNRAPNQNVQLPSFLSPPPTTCTPETSCASNEMNWSRDYQKQTLQNTTTAEPIDLGRLILSRNANQTAPQPREQDGNNLLLSLDETLYSKLFGSSYGSNPSNYFF
ncbi:predicted protein [Naegleria gruberi]|uniref:Predicted protein n=1 Tax=Naegleria gruberi TaxID=5762 RepID=D2VG95_NAEGR|nr:uncharacterized protein NAEGRDRAFT_49291 [Naegleria gruberi]EFC44231.1 predicted protein [Naegleria gruberi]|eukprot:XP_002676975.1 predicted protein [Naegleria gruberi strain NEG-M]